MSKRILIVSYHFYPDAQVGAKRMSELARYLCDQGHEVVVVASSPAGKGSADPQLQLESSRLRRVSIPSPPKILPKLMSWLKRLRGRSKEVVQARHAETDGESQPSAQESLLQKLKRFYFSLEWLVDDRKLWSALVSCRLYGFLFSRPFDVVISSGPPMSAHLAVLLARPVLRCRWVVDMRDPWCDQEHHQDVQSSFSRRVNRWLEGRVMAAADAKVVTTPGYLRTLQQRYHTISDQIFLVLNGFGGEVVSSPAPLGKLQLLYAGSLYYNRNPFPLLRALRELANQAEVDRSLVSCRFYGDCDFWNGISLNDWIEENDMQDCISLHPPVSAADVPGLMAESNVLINFAQGQPMQIPAKTFDYIAARREILLVTEENSDTAWLGRSAGCARIVPPGSDDAMCAALLSLYRDYVTASQGGEINTSALSAFSRMTQNEHYIDLLDLSPVVEQEVGL